MLSNQTICWLSEKQTILDNYICEAKQITVNTDVLKKKVVAFFVELGEYANEERSFKYWANKPPSELAIQLDEYIDGVHFIISIGNQIGFDFSQFEQTNLGIDNNVDLYLALINCLAGFMQEFSLTSYQDLLNCYLAIMIVQQYSETEIVDAYQKKNEVNFARQDTNY